MADPPTWSLVVDAASKGVAGLAVVLGGSIGYIRYARGRVFHTKVDLDISVETTDIGSQPALKIEASIKNDGSCRVAFREGDVQEIQVSACYDRPWRDACESLQPVVWTLYYSEPFTPSGTTTNTLTELEPGQRSVRRVLVPCLESPRPVAYRIGLYVEGHSHPIIRYKKHSPWSTERVVEEKAHG